MKLEERNSLDDTIVVLVRILTLHNRTITNNNYMCIPVYIVWVEYNLLNIVHVHECYKRMDV